MTMLGPGEYIADCTEGITRVEDLPPCICWPSCVPRRLSRLLWKPCPCRSGSKSKKCWGRERR